MLLASRCHFTSVSTGLFMTVNNRVVSLAASHYVNIYAGV